MFAVYKIYLIFVVQYKVVSSYMLVFLLLSYLYYNVFIFIVKIIEYNSIYICIYTASTKQADISNNNFEKKYG